ncbi:hypothetical protein ALQ60_04514 [Pseudomonas syringae pv. papulans]|nr:hypothetical protein ALQ60_04514 [Pseudomonas syringae pv. papulans]
MALTEPIREYRWHIDWTGHERFQSRRAESITAIRGWPLSVMPAPGARAPETIDSSLVHALLDRVLDFAFRLLAFAFQLLYLAFSPQFVVVGSLANSLLDVTNCFVGHTFGFIAGAAHRKSPGSEDRTGSDVVLDKGLTCAGGEEFQLFSGPLLPFICRALGQVCSRVCARMRATVVRQGRHAEHTDSQERYETR